MTHVPDRLFTTPLAQVPDFTFNEDVVRVFPDMIKRSVPGYPTIVENTGVLAAQFAQANSTLYDLAAHWAPLPSYAPSCQPQWL